MGSIVGVRRNTVFAFLSQAIRLVANFALFVGLARLYGPADFGRFTAVHTLAVVFVLLADFGLDVLTSSEIARQRVLNRNPTGDLFFVKVMLACLASVSMALVVLFYRSPEEGRALGLIFCPFVFFSSLLNFYFAVFKGHEQLQHETRISFYSNVLLLIVVVGMGLVRSSIVTIAVAFVVSRILGVALAMRVRGSIGRIVPSMSLKSVRPMLGSVAVYGLHSVLGTLYFTQDTLLLSVWTTDRTVGIYQSAFKLVSLSLIAADVIFYTMLPVLTRLYESDQVAWAAAGRLVYKTLLFLSLPIGLVMIVYPGPIIGIVYGEKEFAEAIPLLQLFGLTVVVRYIVDTSATMLTASRRQSRRLVVVSAAVLVNLVLNSLAIPRYGATGAAVVSLITNVFVGIGYVVFARDVALKWLVEARNVLPVLSAISLGAILWSQRGLSFWIAAPAAVSMLIIISYTVGYSRLERERLFTLRGVIRKPWGE